MFQKPTIFGTPKLSGGLLGGADTEGCCHNTADNVCDTTFTPDGGGCEVGIAIGGAVVGALTGAGTTAGIAKGLFPGPADAG
jgi:hypothetical protein